jgi:hypothetical protein
MDHQTIAEIVHELQLEAHPEGGFYKRFYTSTFQLPGEERPLVTSILYLLPAGCFGSLHRLQSDELWLYQSGQCLTVTEIDSSGVVAKRVVKPGCPLNVKAGTLFGSSLDAPAGSFALVCCVVVPGFKWEEFDMPTKEILLKTYQGNPAALEVVEALSR